MKKYNWKKIKFGFYFFVLCYELFMLGVSFSKIYSSFFSEPIELSFSGVVIGIFGTILWTLLTIDIIFRELPGYRALSIKADVEQGKYEIVSMGFSNDKVFLIIKDDQMIIPVMFKIDEISFKTSKKKKVLNVPDPESQRKISILFPNNMGLANS